MKRILIALGLLAFGCAHGIRNVSDCKSLKAADREIECGACTLKNSGGNVLGTWEYRNDAADGQRCVRVD